MTERAILAAVLVLLPLSLIAADEASCPRFDEQRGPAVIMAVAPRFPDIAVQARISTTFEVCVAVGADGVPVTATLQPTFLIMKPATETAALLWRFERPTPNQSRQVRLRFVYRLIPRDSEPAEETSLFRPPYEVETRHLSPEPITVPIR